MHPIYDADTCDLDQGELVQVVVKLRETIQNLAGIANKLEKRISCNNELYPPSINSSDTFYTAEEDPEIDDLKNLARKSTRNGKPPIISVKLLKEKFERLNTKNQ